MNRPAPAGEITDALALLAKDRLVLAIHDSCFPAVAGEDIGRGSPYGRGGQGLLRFARELGFDGIQFGPQGQTSRDDPSPYDGTLFSRNILSIDWASVTRDPLFTGLLEPEHLCRMVQGNTSSDSRHTAHRYAYDACHQALDAMYRRLEQQTNDKLAAELDAFTAHHKAWLFADALYHALAVQFGGLHQRDWPVTNEACTSRDLYRHSPEKDAVCAARQANLEAHHRYAMARYRLGQFIVHRQHAAFRKLANEWGVRMYGDLQVGLSSCDLWSRGDIYLSNYYMGAPPSRTNPEGQPWNYGVLDPEQYYTQDGKPGPVLIFMAARISKMLEEFDGLRVDHPHGLVCPWVYAAADPDPLHAVQHGARLFSSPNLPDHPELARYAIIRETQLNTHLPRYDDNWVRTLEPAQIDRYATLLDNLVESVLMRGGTVADVLCEILSTQPYPLAQVIQRHGLDRFRVTQKANLDNPADVYRSENALPEDWIMVGNHDTQPIWRLARHWEQTGENLRQAEYLARRLQPAGDVESLVRELSADRRKLVHAKFADLFISPARHVMIFFADLLGLEEVYNTPGTVNEENWSLRVPPDYAQSYAAACRRGDALNLPWVLALALKQRGAEFARAHAGLITRLEQSAGF
ncbi:MAG: 4-alpha-glucanotransferase [Gammaproteobacteria bacterium]|nr:4-alpha-glucanotransferase [Gammaproteobacteria bacterium]